MPKHYKVVKMIICDITGQQCGDTISIKDPFNQCCDYCNSLKEFKKSGMTLEEWKADVSTKDDEMF